MIIHVVYLYEMCILYVNHLSPVNKPLGSNKIRLKAIFVVFTSLIP